MNRFPNLQSIVFQNPHPNRHNFLYNLYTDAAKKQCKNAKQNSSLSV